LRACTSNLDRQLLVKLDFSQAPKWEDNQRKGSSSIFTTNAASSRFAIQHWCRYTWSQGSVGLYGSSSAFDETNLLVSQAAQDWCLIIRCRAFLFMVMSGKRLDTIIDHMLPLILHVWKKGGGSYQTKTFDIRPIRVGFHAWNHWRIIPFLSKQKRQRIDETVIRDFDMYHR
jgi:hypothetical protein